MATKIKIALIDDHILFRRGLAELLGNYAKELKIVFELPVDKDLFHSLKKAQPQIILLGAQLPESESLKTLDHIREAFPGSRILLFLMQHDEGLIFDLLKKGVSGFISRDKTPEELREAILSVHQKGFYHTEEITQAMLNGVRNRQKARTSLNASDLTERELEIIRFICKQMSLKDIASKLKLSPRTIETHKENILMKTGAKNTVGIALYAVEHQLL